jgi:hypothetical protein
VLQLTGHGIHRFDPKPSFSGVSPLPLSTKHTISTSSSVPGFDGDLESRIHVSLNHRAMAHICLRHRCQPKHCGVVGSQVPLVKTHQNNSTAGMTTTRYGYHIAATGLCWNQYHWGLLSKNQNPVHVVGAIEAVVRNQFNRLSLCPSNSS